MFLSLLVARRFRGKVFALLAIIVSGVIAFFSVGVPTFVTFPEYNSAFNAPQSGVLLENPLPLSFPVYGSLSVDSLPFSYARRYYELHLSSLTFYRDWILGESAGYIWLKLSVINYALYCLFFMFVNLAGAAIGLWLSRRSFMDRLSKPVKRVGPAVIVIALGGTSAYFLFSAYQLWSGYNWAMWTFHSPLPVGEGGRLLSRQLISAIDDYVALFPRYFFAGLVFATFALVTAVAAINPRRKALIVAAIAMVSSALLFFEAYNLATGQALSGSAPYFRYTAEPAVYGYQTLFWLYLLSGSIAVASGIILVAQKHFKVGLRELKPPLFNNTMRAVVIVAIEAGCFVLSLYFLINAYIIWGTYNWAIGQLQHPPLFVGSSALYPQLSLAIADYAGVFPSYFVGGVLMLTLTLVLATLTINSRKTVLLIAIFLVSGAILLGEAYKIWEIYMWSNLYTTTPPLSYYSNFRGSALASYENLFWLSLQIGVLELVSGLALAGIRLRGRFKDGPKEPTLLLDNNEKTKKR